MKNYLLKMFIIIVVTVITHNIYSSSSYAECSQKHYIVSDFDDTIKTYKNRNLLPYIKDGLWGVTVNAGMSELINNMIKENSFSFEECCNEELFTILSASMTFLTYSINRLLKKNNFLNSKLVLKKRPQKTFNFKVKALNQIKKRVTSPFILIGDDTSYDHLIYEKFKQSNPGRVSDIYIHKVKGSAIPEGQISYLTSFDIAYSEYLKGRLSKDVVVEIGVVVLNAPSNEIIAEDGYCPVYISPCDDLFKGSFDNDIEDVELSKLRDKIYNRIYSICIDRVGLTD